jgi:hypothetical protein
VAGAPFDEQLRAAIVWLASAGAEGGGERVLAAVRLFERAGDALLIGFVDGGAQGADLQPVGHVGPSARASRAASSDPGAAR